MKKRASVNRSRGVAILVIMTVITLMTVLVVSMLSMTAQSRTQADAGVRIANARTIADTAIELTIGQLRTATTQEISPGVPAPWVSQPGAVTVHEMNGEVKEIRKLYSAEHLTASSATEAAADLPSGWRKFPGQYVDLNEPILSSDGNITFPIADPRAADGENAAEGFTYGGGADTPNGTVAPGRGELDQLRLPMPVRWLYQLRDGTLGVMGPGGEFTNESKARATPENPITARFAFWADDESSKININTAGEAATWDTPRVTTKQDEGLAWNQPMRGEFHRYPGHPAGVSLSSVLYPRHRWYLPGDRVLSNFPALTQDQADTLWRIAPGTLSDHTLTSMGGHQRPPGLDLPASQDAVGSWHLYTSPEEAVFSHAEREPRPDLRDKLARADFLLTAHSRSPETTLFGRPRVSLWPVHRDVKPGEPPSEVLPRSTAMDGLLAMCGTTGTEEAGTRRAYYMQRAVPGDGWADYYTTALGANAKLIPWVNSFLDREIPGFARDTGTAEAAGRVVHRTFAEKYGPGPEGDAQNIVLLMFDYIRATNLADGNISRDMQFSIVCPGNPTKGYGQISPLSAASGNTGLARWKPEQWHTARGLGRMPTISGATLVFNCRALVDADGEIQGKPSTQGRQFLKTPGDREMEAVVLFDSFVPGQGWAESRPYCQLAFAGVVPGAPADFSTRLPYMNVNGATMAPRKMKEFSAFIRAIDQRNGMRVGYTGSGGGSGNFLNGVLAFEPFVVKAGVDGAEFLRFSGSDIGSSPGIRVGVFDNPDTGFEVTVPKDTKADEIPEEDLVQVMDLHFPGTPARSILLPGLPAGGVPVTWEERLAKAVSDEDMPLISPQDVTLALVPPHGDMRLLAGQRLLGFAGNLPQDSIPALVPHPDYGLKAQSNIVDRAGTEEPVLFPDLPQPLESAPRIPLRPWDTASRVPLPTGRQGSSRIMTPAELFGAARLDGDRSSPRTPDRGPAQPDLTGDFDTGVGRAPYGSYVNRADDGEVRGYKNNGVPYFDPPDSDPNDVPPVSAAAASPNRLVSGPGMFGSLPTGVKARVPWQTLLFRPWFEGDADPSKWDKNRDHYGWSWPRDHLLMDFFWMPVAEPYGISTPLETAGKINLNSDMLPFTSIRRSTALHALLKSERIIAIPDGSVKAVKRGAGEPFSDVECRHPIDADGTLALWREEKERRGGKLFLSASEVCELPLVPAGVEANHDVLRTWWRNHRLTGDNLKERPYTNLHARLTTRGNVYRVHILAQSLQKGRSGEPNKWVEGTDTVASVWRGSAIVSRTVDPAKLPDYVATPDAAPVDEFYTWNVTGVRQIAPR